jgi:hypothetical protein
MDLHEAVRQEIMLLEKRRDELCEKPLIKEHLEEAAQFFQTEYGRSMSDMERRNIAQCLDNAILTGGLKNHQRLFEATTTEDYISFLGIQLPVITALLPSLVLNDVATVQALDRRIGGVFYLDVRATNAKGDAAAASTLISSKTGAAAGKGARYYASSIVPRETVQTGNGTTSGTTTFNPGIILLANAYIESLSAAGVYTTIATCNSSGTFQDVAGDGITVSGTLNAAGTYSITAAGLNSTDTVLLTYFYQYDLPKDVYNNNYGVPEEDVIVTQETITAIDFPVRAKFSVGASIDLQKAHGMNLEDELVKYLAGGVKWAIDQYGLDQIIAASSASGAATAPTSWNAAIHSGQEWLWHKYEFLDRLQEGSNNIYQKTKRGVANFMICGNNVARVVKQLTQGGDFKPSAAIGKQIPTGPLNIGNISSVNNMVVIQNPYMSDNYYTLGFKGDSFLYASFIYAPYIPLFASPTIILSDLIAQKGFLSSAGFKVINSGLFCQGQITNLGTTA